MRRDVLGLKPTWEGDPDWAQLALGGDDLSLVRKDGSKHPPHLGFRVESRDKLKAAHEHLVARGVPVEKMHGHRDGSMSFYGTAVETRNAQGDPSKPGAGAAWFRLQVPVVEGHATSPAMRAVAAADFGNGLSWVLPAERYLFANADLSRHLHRLPVGDWIGLMAQTQMDGSGAGTTLSRLFDEQGGFGVAVQTLALRER